MSKPVVTSSKTHTVAYAAKLMEKMHVGTVVILEKNKPIGIISERDIINKVVAKNKALDISIEMVMTKKIVMAECTITDVAAAALMTKYHVKKLPLTKNGKLVGMITQTDLLKILSEKWLM
jgi:CBS domain-containing protein